LVVVAAIAGAVRRKIAQADARTPTHLQDTRATGFVEADMFRNTALSALLASTMTLAVVGQIGAQTSVAQNAAARACGHETVLALAARASHSHGG
jgi:hypothetical protein